MDLGDRVVGEQLGGAPGLLEVVAGRSCAVSSGVMPFIWYLTVIRCSSAASTPNYAMPEAGLADENGRERGAESMSWFVIILIDSS